MIALAAVVVVVVVACASIAGLCAHLLWLLVADPIALWRIVAWVVGV